MEKKREWVKYRCAACGYELISRSKSPRCTKTFCRSRRINRINEFKNISEVHMKQEAKQEKKSEPAPEPTPEPKPEPAKHEDDDDEGDDPDELDDDGDEEE